MNVETGIKMDVPALTTGHGMVIDSLNGNALLNDGSGGYGTGGSLLTLKGTSQTSGTLLDIDASALSDGRAIRIQSLTNLTSGALLDIKTSTTLGDAAGAIRITAEEMQGGTGIKIKTRDLTTGWRY